MPTWMTVSLGILAAWTLVGFVSARFLVGPLDRARARTEARAAIDDPSKTPAPTRRARPRRSRRLAG